MTRAAAIVLLASVACGGGDDAAPDARAVVLACDPEAQDCPAGEKCNPSGAIAPWDGTLCVPDNAGSGSPTGTPCFTGPDFSDTCDESSTCMQLGTGEGFCTAFCTDTPADTCDAAQRCVLHDDAIGLKLCADRCDLAAPECPRFYKCIETLAGPACVPMIMQDLVP